MPYFVPASVLGKNGAVPPSEQIQLGAIGIRGRGMHDLRWIMSEKDVRMARAMDAFAGRG